MKHNKLFAVLAMAAVMTLAACGGGKGGSGAASGSKAGGSGSKAPTTSIPPEPTKGVWLEEAKLVTKTDGKVCIQFKAYETLMTATDTISYAFGLASGSGDSLTFVHGKESPEATDFKALTFTPAADKSRVDINFEEVLTDIDDIPTGVYNIYFGFKAEEYAALDDFVSNNSDFTGRDTKYDYFMRDDGNPSGLAIEDLGPFAVTEGSVVKLAAGDLPAPAQGEEQTLPVGLYAKLGGAQAETYTQDQLNAWNTHCDFQRHTPQYRKNALSNFFWKVEGNKVFIYMSVAEMAADETYMTHLTANAKAGSDEERNPGKCLPSAAFEQVCTFTEENLKFTVIGDPTKGQTDGQDHFYGAVGFRVEAAVEAAE